MHAYRWDPVKIQGPKQFSNPGSKTVQLSWAQNSSVIQGAKQFSNPGPKTVH